MTDATGQQQGRDNGELAGPPSVRAQAQQAVSARYRRDLLHSLVRTLPIGAGVGLALAIAERQLGGLALTEAWPTWGVLTAGLAPFAIALAWSIITTARARPEDALVEVDAALGLQDRLASPLRFVPGTDEGMRALADAMGERAADQADPALAYPLQGWRWIGGSVLLAGLAGASATLPAREWTPEQPVAPVLAKADTDPETIESIEQVREELSEIASAGVSNDQIDEAIEELEALQRELSAGEEASQARERAASTLEQAADNIERQARAAKQRDQALQDRLSEISAPDDDARDLAEALQQADLARAANEAQRLQERSQELDDAERERLADSLRDLAQQLEQPEPPEQQSDAPQPKDLGISEQARESIGQSTSPDEIQETLEQEGIEPESARDLAEQIAQRNQQQQAQEQAQRQAEQIADALRDEADRVEDPSQPQDQPEDGQPDSQQSEPDSQNGSENTNESGDESQPDEQPGQQPSDQPQGQEPGDRPGSEIGQTPRQQTREQSADPSPGAESSENGTSKQPGQEPGQQQENQSGNEPSNESGPEQGQDPGNQQGQDSGSQPNEQPGDQPGNEPGNEPGNQPGSQQGNDPGQQPGSQPGQQPGQQPGSQPGANESEVTGGGQSPDGEPGVTDGEGTDQSATPEQSPGQGAGQGDDKGLGDRLREMHEQQQRSPDTTDSQRLRERAQQLLEQASPEEIARAQELARAMARERGKQEWDGLTETFDARQDPGEVAPDERVIGRWFGDGVRGEGLSTETVQRRLEQAAEGVERAIEDQSIPPRHADLVRRVFRRYVDREPAGRVQDAADAPPADAPDAENDG